MLFEGLIDEGLIVSAASMKDLCFKELERVGIDSDRDLGFVLWRGDDRPSLGVFEVVFVAHGVIPRIVCVLSCLLFEQR